MVLPHPSMPHLQAKWMPEMSLNLLRQGWDSVSLILFNYFNGSHVPGENSARGDVIYYH
jgi:hypothetical protein